MIMEELVKVLQLEIIIVFYVFGMNRHITVFCGIVPHTINHRMRLRNGIHVQKEVPLGVGMVIMNT